jgi:ribonuclease HI
MLEMSAQINELQAAAYHRERVAGRRLARLTGVSEAQALRHILLQAAAPGSLDDLLQTRRAAREAALAQRAARRQHKLEMRAQKNPAAQSEVEAWQGWFDGSSHPNPGRIGIGGVLHGPAAQRIEICAYAGHGDSNQAEYLALIAVLEAALEVRPQALIVYGDSQVVIGDVGKACGAGALVLLPYRERVQHLLAQLGGVSLKWIARHKNAAADALSQRAVKQQMTKLQQPADI